MTVPYCFLTALALGTLALMAPALAVADDGVDQTHSLDWEEQVPVETGMGGDSSGQAVGDRVLRLVQRSTTGKVLASQAALSVLSGGLSGFSFKKDNLRGSKIKSVPNPAFDSLPDQVHAALEAYFAAHPAAIPAEYSPVQLTAWEFSLVYNELSDARTEYTMQQVIEIGFPIRRNRFRQLPRAGEGAKCRIDTPVWAPLETWQADDYAHARAVSLQQADLCLASFVAQLPQLFPDPQQPASAVDSASTPDVESADRPPVVQAQG